MHVPFTADGGWLSMSVQAVSVAGLLSLFGTQAFRVWVAPRFMPLPGVARRQRGIAWGSLVLAAAGLLGWLLLQSMDMAGAVSAAPAVAAGTAFGHVILLQLAALVAAAAAFRRAWAACLLAGVACALQAGHSHAFSMYDGPSWLLASDAVHLLAAGAWLGGLLPLLIVVAGAPASSALLAARWFSPLGKLCLVAMAVTAGFQGWVMIGSVPGLVGTGYGWMALVKLALFGVLTGFAWMNRYRLAPALLRPGGARMALARSIAVQTGFGLAVIAAAAVLASMAPAMHTQPVWPFPDRFTLDVVQADPAFAREAVTAAAALAAALVLAAAAVWLRRARWPLVAAALAVAAVAAPHLDLLFVPAYPTSFYRSPAQFAAGSILAGAALYPSHCAACHGADGHGDGPAARALAVPPADLTAAHLWMHSDGELFWWLYHGIDAPEGGMAMPAVPGLGDDDRWALIDYIRGHNAGLAFRAAGVFPVPVQAPGLQADCADGRTLGLPDLRGGFVRLVFGTAAPVDGVTTILVDPGAPPSPGLCVVNDEAAPAAYAIVLGRDAASLDGLQVLVDGDGWLRAAAPGWADLPAELAELRRNPVAAPAPMDMPM